MSFKALSLPVMLLSILLVSCSGNESALIFNPDSTLSVVTGVVHSGRANNIEVQGVAVGVNGKLTLNEETGQLTGVSGLTDDRGRFALGLNSENSAAVIMFARGSEIDESMVISSIQCKLPQGCNVRQGESDEVGEVEFGGYYNPEYYYDYAVNEAMDDDPETRDELIVSDTTLWSAGLEFAAQGQFISINTITDMASFFGLSTYVSESGQCDENECDANKQATGYFSKYGIVKANTQLANLLGLSDIVSKEPANIAALDSISSSNTVSLIESIRYGALIAALQQIQLEYDNALTHKTDRRFRRELYSQFAENVGQLYQKDAPIAQVITLESWLATARDVLIAANDHFNSLGKSLPIEVGSVILDFNSELEVLSDLEVPPEGLLTKAVPNIPEDLAGSYENEIKYTKAMLNHLTRVADEFSNPEYRNKAKTYQQQLDAIGNDVSPAFNAVTGSMLDLYGYYISCNYGPCDPVNQWHDHFSSFDVNTKILILKYSEQEGDQLKISQRVVDLIANDDITSPTDSLAIDFIVQGVIKTDDLTVITDFSDETIGEASMRVSYNINATQLLIDDSLRSLNPSMPAQVESNPVFPVAYEFSFTTLELNYLPEEHEQHVTLQGAFSWLLRGVRDVRRINDPTVPWRYNLNNLSIVMNLTGKEFVLNDTETISDNVVMSITGTGFNTSNYFPDTVFPEITNYFVPKEGREVGASSDVALLKTSIIDYDFPAVDEEGVPIEGSILEGEVQPNKSERVKILKFDYLHAGAAAFVVYPPRNDGKYLGMICSVPTELEEYFDHEVVKNGIIGNITYQDENAERFNIFNCSSQAFYQGDANVNDFINQVWDIEPNFVRAINVQGEGVYFADLATLNDEADLASFSSEITEFTGTMFAPAMLGIDNLRVQIRPQLNNGDNSGKLAEVALDLNLIRPTTSSINVGLFVAYNPEQIFNTDEGLPYLASGDNTESYYIAYKTDSQGNETGAFIFNWQGAQLVDGVLQNYDESNIEPMDSFLFNLGSDVFYSESTEGVNYTRCGLIFPGEDSEQKCEAVAYLTFRGFVTGTIREERPGVYVARFIDGDWQIVGK